MSAQQPDRALMRAVAEVVINEEKARVIADRELAADLVRLREQFEAFGKTMLPPELANQVKTAIRLLHELPPIVKTGQPT